MKNINPTAGKAIIVPSTPENIALAAQRIKEGKLVSFSTQTVYGLGANGLDHKASLKIFQAKGKFNMTAERPLTDPLILHVNDKKTASELVEQSEVLQSLFEYLADQIWPGPMTVVMQANKKLIHPIITANTGFVGIRSPNHPIAKALIEAAGVPIAAPSANKFGHVSPTKPDHVFKDFENNDVMILDGGACTVGIESTVIKLIEEKEGSLKIFILRRGGLSEEKLRSILSKSESFSSVEVQSVGITSHKQESQDQQAPGQFLRHYAPNIESYLFLENDEEGKGDIELELKKCILIDFGKLNADKRDLVKAYTDLSQEGQFDEGMLKIYDFLRWAETHTDAEYVLISDFKHSKAMESQNKEHMDALFDRIFRATSGRRIEMGKMGARVVKLA